MHSQRIAAIRGAALDVSHRVLTAVRANYMFGFSAAALVVAAAAGVGGLGSLGVETKGKAPPSQPVAVISAPAPSGPAQPLAMYYLLVSSEEQAAVFAGVENTIVNREALWAFAFEVLVVRTPDEEREALRVVEEARRRAPGVRLTVEDLRRR